MEVKQIRQGKIIPPEFHFVLFISMNYEEQTERIQLLRLIINFNTRDQF